MAAPSLSLFSPPSEPTFLELYSIHWEHLRGKGTRACDLEALRFFDRLHPNVPAHKLTFEHTRKARRELDERVKAKKISRNQANKIGRHLNRFLKLLGPNDGSIDPEEPLALQPLGILPAPLRLAVPAKQRRQVDGWIDLDESGAFLAAADAARWCNPVTKRAMLATRLQRKPPQIAAAAWFRSVWLLLYNSALRIDEANQVEWTDRRSNKFGEWLYVSEEVSKTGHERNVYLNQYALAALEQLKRCNHKRILAWDYSLSFLDRMRREIYDLANLHRLLELEIGWHGLRKACATELVTICGRSNGVNGIDIAGLHLGHRLKTVTAEHYIHETAVIPYVDRLPQPRFEPPKADEARQMKLFD